MHTLRTLMFLAALIAAVLLAMPALAQETSAEPSGTLSQENNAEPAEESTDAEDEEAERVLDTITVIGRAQQLYRVNESSTAKLPGEALDTPIAITSINEQLIEDQGARDAQDIYRNISGVSLFSYAGVTARGFRQEEIFFDGLRGDPYIGFNVPQLFNIERVDFLKGPAGMLYGPGAPGGLFNYITKKPEQQFSANIKAIAGNRDRFGGSGEITGSLANGIAGRVGVFYEEEDNFRFNADVETRILDAGLSFDLGFADLVLQATHYDQDQGGNRLRGVPVDDDGNFLVTRRWNHNEASDFLNLESTNLQVGADGTIADNLTWNATFRYTDAEQVQNYHEPRALIDSDGDGAIDLVGREFRDQTRTEEKYTFGANAIWSADLGSVQNRLLSGFEYFEGTNEFLSGGAFFSPAFVTRFLTGTSLPSDIIPLELSATPNYGVTDPTQYNIGFFPLRVTDTTREGFYLLDEVTIGPVILSGGIRFDWFSNGDLDESDETLRFGAIYKIRDDVSLFAQWAESFVPQSEGNQNPQRGGPFAPVTGEIIEAGIKTSLANGGVRTSLSVYEIKRQNFLQLLLDENGQTVDVGNDGQEDLTALGEVTSRGVEFDVVADVTDNWVLTLAYAYNDTEITKDNGTVGFRNSVGTRFANAPEHQLGLWTRYQVPSINTAFAFGTDYVDDQISLSGQTVKDFVVFDASIIWASYPFKVQLRIDNIFDKTYARSGFIERTGHFPGEPRSVFVEVGYTFL